MIEREDSGMTSSDTSPALAGMTIDIQIAWTTGMEVIDTGHREIALATTADWATVMADSVEGVTMNMTRPSSSKEEEL